ncbi:MAG: lysophospholipid acyltransferase family protein [Kiritimatiellae bacterium]|nr:lysophospholipid acyltransferase family protein [Kiritimatiellia bacterium]
MAEGAPRIRFRHRAEYVALAFAGAIVRWAPHRVSLALAWGVAAVMHGLFGFRRKEARRRLRAVLGPETRERVVRRAAWRSFRNLCFNAVDTLRAPRLTPRWFREHVLLAGRVEWLEQCRASGRGLILAASHSGNWELCALGLQRMGYPLFLLARRQKNPLTDDYLNRMRASAGAPALMNDDPGLLRQTIRRLRAGEVLALLPDVRARTPAHAIPFFGGIANLGAGPALLARQSGARLITVEIERLGWTRHRLTFGDAVEPDPETDRDADARRVMTEIMARLEGHIRARPDQYFWYNRRWVLDPLTPAESPAASDAPP